MKKPVLDEREQQQLYQIEHVGLSVLELLLCIAILIQLIMGMGFAAIAGECIALMVVSLGMIAAYIYYGIWDAENSPAGSGNIQYALLTGLCLGVLYFGLTRNIAHALVIGVMIAILAYGLLIALMKGIARRKEQQAEAYEAEMEESERDSD